MAKVALDAAPLCCTHMAQAARAALPTGSSMIAIDEGAQVYRFGTIKSLFVMRELPRFTRPYRLVATSLATPGVDRVSLLLLRIETFDADFKPLRVFDETALRYRDDNAEHTVFVNSVNAGERYIVFYAADAAVEMTRDQPSVTVTPVFVGRGVMNVYDGQDRKRVIRSAPVGRVKLELLAPDLPAPS